MEIEKYLNLEGLASSEYTKEEPLISDSFTGNELAKRYNKGKARWSLVDFEALSGLVEVLEFGANKYGENNWRKGLKTCSIVDSTLRHLYSYLLGEDLDKESSLRHIDHALANLMMLSRMDKSRKDLDNRYFLEH